jgi:hypothetical protein
MKKQDFLDLPIGETELRYKNLFSVVITKVDDNLFKIHKKGYSIEFLMDMLSDYVFTTSTEVTSTDFYYEDFNELSNFYSFDEECLVNII